MCSHHFCVIVVQAQLGALEYAIEYRIEETAEMAIEKNFIDTLANDLSHYVSSKCFQHDIRRVNTNFIYAD